MSDASEHWDSVYSNQSVRPVPDDDAVGLAAVAHFGSLAGARLVDLGCGNGEHSLFFADRGAHVVGIDRSQKAIENLTAYTHVHPVSGGGSVEAKLASARDLEALGTFDLAFGSMILHHLEPFDDFAARLRGAIRPGGRGFFYENNAMSSVLVWCRRHLVGHYGIPKHGDDDEFPLEPREIRMLERRFAVEVEYPRLLLAEMATVYLLRHHGDLLARKVDERLYRFAWLRKYSYRQYVKLS